MPLARARNRGGGGRPDSGSSGRRCRGPRGGIATGEGEIPRDVLGWVGEAGRRLAGVSSGSPAVANGGGVAPAAQGDGELAVEIQRTTRKLVRGLI